MRPSITLSIPQPCPERWETMQAVEQGRHCVSCERVVHDFTKFTDQELVAWFAQQTGPVCGRLRDDQLAVALYENQPVAPRFTGWVRWAITLVLGWQTARAQSSQPMTPPAQPVSITPIRGQTTLVNNSGGGPLRFQVQGTVVDEEGRPLSRVLVMKETSASVVETDENGRFSLPIYAADQTKNSLRVTFAGKGRVNVDLSVKQELAPIRVVIPYVCDKTVSGGGVIVRRTSFPKRAWWSVKRLFASR